MEIVANLQHQGKPVKAPKKENRWKALKMHINYTKRKDYIRAKEEGNQEKMRKIMNTAKNTFNKSVKELGGDAPVSTVGNAAEITPDKIDKMEKAMLEKAEAKEANGDAGSASQPKTSSQPTAAQSSFLESFKNLSTTMDGANGQVEKMGGTMAYEDIEDDEEGDEEFEAVEQPGAQMDAVEGQQVNKGENSDPKDGEMEVEEVEEGEEYDPPSNMTGINPDFVEFFLSEYENKMALSKAPVVSALLAMHLPVCKTPDLATFVTLRDTRILMEPVRGKKEIFYVHRYPNGQLCRLYPPNGDPSPTPSLASLNSYAERTLDKDFKTMVDKLFSTFDKQNVAKLSQESSPAPASEPEDKE